jgi:hypothetical protein
MIVIFGCAIFLLAAVLLAFTTQMAPAGSLAAPFLHTALIFDIILDLAFVGWGVASGIGLLQLQQWARISMLVFSGIMIFFCLIPMAIFPFVPIPQPAAAPANLMFLIRFFLELFYGFFVALGAFWIYFFNRRNVKAQFSGAPSPPEGGITPAGAVTFTDARPKRPVPIIVLGVLMLLGGGCFMPFAVFLHTPVLLFGVLMHNTAGDIVLLVLAVLNVVAGIGLLRFRPWGWSLALFAQIFNIVNIACFIVVPRAAELLNTAMAQQYASMGITNLPPGFSPGLVMRITYGAGLLLGIAFVGILMAYRKAFLPSNPTAAI